MWLAAFAGFACNRSSHAATDVPLPAHDLTYAEGETPTEAVAVFAGGCFWCTEAVFEPLRGVSSVVSGYAGGDAANANYSAVSAGRTDHAEAIAITYDPSQISYGQLLQVFFAVAHDPTQLNRQGPDVGEHYRSAVFVADDTQRDVVEAYLAQLGEAEVFGREIVTTIEPLTKFHPAEAYHQDYVEINPGQPYVVFNALPKVEKLRETFPDLIAKP
ncbi:MAG: peptide-methionine (S)-S-oxide reductase MsrA [Planctomycetota bacterium]